LGLSIVFFLLQLFAIALVYSQVAYEIMEKKSVNVKKSVFTIRNLLPRLHAPNKIEVVDVETRRCYLQQ